MKEDDAKTLFLSLLGSIIVLILAVYLLGGCAVVEKPMDETPTTDVGQPLDAIRYKPPAWASGDSCYRVRDRQTGKEWWLLEMRTEGGKLEWVALERGNA